LPAICSDNNPLTYRLTFRDGDGATSINTLGLWVANSAPLSSGNSAHALISKGTWIRIDAQGQCRHGCPNMRVIVAGNSISQITVAAVRGNYYFYSPTPISAKDVTIEFTNDYADSGGDRNLILNSISLGVSKETGTYI
jgi:hypothetical protein